jgi:hypothetical protein
MPSGLADREGVQGDQVTGAGGEGQNPNGPSFGCRGQDPGGGCGELGQGSDPLGPPAEPVAPQELVDPRRRQTPPLVGQVADQLAGAQGRPGDRFSEHPLDLVGWGRGRHSRRPAILGQQRGQPVALGPTGPAVGGRAGDPEGAAGLGRAGRPGPVQDLDTPVVDDLCWGQVVDS